MMKKEYRAVFTYPRGAVSYGPPRDTVEEAKLDSPPRAEETLAYLSGIETRLVSPGWEPMTTAD